jgi:hypothetical protein
MRSWRLSARRTWPSNEESSSRRRDAHDIGLTESVSTQTGYCDVPPASADSVCNGAAPAGFATCITMSGPSGCPAGTPFLRSYLVGDGTALQCSCSACKPETTCAGATLTAFSDSACSRQAYTVPVDGACNPATMAGSGPTSATAIEYTATASSTCTAGSPTSTVQLMNPRTICCR